MSKICVSVIPSLTTTGVVALITGRTDFSYFRINFRNRRCSSDTSGRSLRSFRVTAKYITDSTVIDFRKVEKDCSGLHSVLTFIL